MRYRTAIHVLGTVALDFGCLENKVHTWNPLQQRTVIATLSLANSHCTPQLSSTDLKIASQLSPLTSESQAPLSNVYNAPHEEKSDFSLTLLLDCRVCKRTVSPRARLAHCVVCACAHCVSSLYKPLLIGAAQGWFRPCRKYRTSSFCCCELVCT